MELKPCPFCGPEGAPRKIGGRDRNKTTCDMCGVINWDWNTRPIEDAQAAEIARLKAEVERLTSDSPSGFVITIGQHRGVIGELRAKIARLTARVAELEGELSALRAAGEGAVTVEGWMYREEGGSFTFTPANMGGMERWESVTVTSRRRP